MKIDFSPVTAELDRLADAGHQATLWLRDDDAVSDTAALRRLAAWAQGAETSALLAVIPAYADDSLAEFLKSNDQLIPCVHGWAHANHAPEGEKSAELGNHRPLDVVCAELAGAKRQLETLLGARALPVLVPPWNRMDKALAAILPALGFTGLSAFGNSFTSPVPAGLTVANTHLDVIDWRGTRGCRPHDELVAELAMHILTRGPAGDPIGILTHHLVHDDDVWQFLDELSALSAHHRGARWVNSFICAK